MKKIILLLLAITFLYSCSTGKKAASSSTNSNSIENSAIKDGSSYANAIVIAEKSESKGVDAEYAWIRKNYPGSKVKKQALSNSDGKPYDIIDIKTADGDNKSIYFDISNFFGKF